MIDQAHALEVSPVKVRTVVGVDPAVTNNEDSDDWGIGVASLRRHDKVCVEADYTIKTSTDKAADLVINAYNKHDADAIVVEVNQGGDLVANVLRLKKFKGRIIQVRASKGKFARAEPISALYEQGLVKHYTTGLEKLETEMTEWVPMMTKQSPNRLDWCVWALTELFDIGRLRPGVF